MDYFKRAAGGYSTTISPVTNYLKQARKFISKFGNVDDAEARIILKRAMSAKKPINPIVTYRKREENGDRGLDKTTLTNYISDTVKSGDIIVPSFTVYDKPTKRKSLHSEFLTINIARRSKHKKLAMVAKQQGDASGHTRNNVLQKVMKIFNNSLSGAYASKSTVLYNPSQHYTLTSITRCVASIGNAVTESVVAGNKCFYTPLSVFNYLTAIVTEVNLKTVSAAMSTYGLVYPSTADVMSMIKHSSARYWSSADAMRDIEEYVSKMDKYELAAIMYVNDLFHMRKLNDDIIKDFAGNLAKRVPAGCDAPLKALNRNVSGVNNLVHHICMEDIKGLEVRYSELKDSHPEILNVLGSTADNIYKVLDKYKLLIKAFFITDILPIDIANIKDMYRDVIVLSDTDSTCGSYDMWTNWYFGHSRFTPEAVGLSAAVMTINTQVMDHNIKVFAKNMNIDDQAAGLLEMKNEFFWSAFITANVSKHYYANTWIQEGMVFKEGQLERKGVHLIGSAGNQDIVAQAEKDMVTTLTKVEQGVKIDPREVLTKIANTERSIIKAIEDGSISMFKLDKVKNATAYKLDDKSKTPYFHHDIWMDVFSEKYGDPGTPTYTTVKIPTTLKSNKKLQEYLASIEDETIRTKLTELLRVNGKVMLGTFRAPLTIAGENGVPKEMLKALDIKRIVLDNMNIHYLQLESLGLFRKHGLLFSEMGY